MLATILKWIGLTMLALLVVMAVVNGAYKLAIFLVIAEFLSLFEEERGK